MKTSTPTISGLILALLGVLLAGLAFARPAARAQDSGQAGFVITLKNGSSIRGKTLSRDDAGLLRLTMTEDGSGAAKSYAMIAMDDADSIHASSLDTDSIRIRVKGGTELRCREFALGSDKVTVKIGARSSVDVPWDQIDSISFSQ